MITKSVADIIQKHVTLEGIDQMYLVDTMPVCSHRAVAFFVRNQFDTPLACKRTIKPITRRFIGEIEQFLVDEQIDPVSFSQRST